MKQYDVMCIGLSTVDLIAGPVDAGVMFRDSTCVDKMCLSIGGNAVNQAVALSKLNCRIGLMALIGEDFWGYYLKEKLEELQINTSLIAMDDQISTTMSIAMLDEKNERHFIVNKGGMEVFGPKNIQKDFIKEADIVSIGSNLALRGLDGEPTCDLFSFARKNGVITAADYSINGADEQIDRMMISDMLKVTDYIFPSYSEAVIITGEKEEKRILDSLLEMGANNIILKLGDKGCYVHADGRRIKIAAYPAQAVDTTGAGDNFVAGFLYGKIHHMDIETCARFGCAAGAIAVEQIGANKALVSEQQLTKRMNIK